jgi:FkbM family methyltransferase
MKSKNLIKKKLRHYLPDYLYDLILINYWRLRHKFNFKYEREIGKLSGLIKKEDLVIDVGSNMGQYAYTFSNIVGPNGCVISIEGSYKTFKLLKKIVKNKNIHFINAAASDEPRILNIHTPVDASGGRASGLAYVSLKEKSINTEQVCAIRLDDTVLKYSKKVAFIKCDVEGHEILVLRGAERILIKDKPTLLLEANNQDAYNQLANYISKFNYRIFRLNKIGDWELSEKFLQENVNYLFINDAN